MNEAADSNDLYKLYWIVVHVDMLKASYTKAFSGNWYRMTARWTVLFLSLRVCVAYEQMCQTLYNHFSKESTIELTIVRMVSGLGLNESIIYYGWVLTNSFRLFLKRNCTINSERVKFYYKLKVPCYILITYNNPTSCYHLLNHSQ